MLVKWDVRRRKRRPFWVFVGIWCHARFSRTDKVNWITGHPVSLFLITDSQGELKTSDTFMRFLPKEQTFIQMEMSLSSESHCICERRIWNSLD